MIMLPFEAFNLNSGKSNETMHIYRISRDLFINVQISLTNKNNHFIGVTFYG